MFDNSSEPKRHGISPSIYLDYGADGHECMGGGFEICERGMRFSSRWQFSLGTQLSVAFSCQDADGKIQRAATEGLIVDCDRVESGCYKTTLLFLELEEPLKSLLQQKGPGKVSGVVEPRIRRSTRPKSNYS